MNTSKQINVMVGLIFILLIVLGGLAVYDPTCQQEARENQTEVLAGRPAPQPMRRTAGSAMETPVRGALDLP